MKEALEELLDATVYLATKLRQLKKLEETNERKENNS